MKKILLIFLAFVGISLGAQAQIDSGLVAKYYFNSGDANDEVGTNDGTVTGATIATDRFGNSDMAYSFDGMDDHIDFGDSSEFQMGTGDFAVSVWVHYTSTQFGAIFSKRDGGNGNYNQYYLAVLADPLFGGASKNLWSYERCSFSNSRAISGGDISGSWKHVVVVHGHLDSTIIYVDGQYVSHDTTDFGGNFNIVGRPFVLGYLSESNNAFFWGSIDDVRVYRRKLSGSEIDSLYNEANPVAVGMAENNENLSSLGIYPNPAGSTLQIHVAQPSTIVLLNMLGQELKRLNVENEAAVDVSGLDAGIYFVRDVTTGKTVKFSKQ
ncbi:MAG: T9SS type A sorting domain-containing protein [Bacteroidia bacterium]|nr:T9SS type A sorting domain-containing protein [Bacteroidota bacterium]MBP6639964.1 T9SS type A sorting domain-containing protein [Bacteroidia bacterium]MBP8073637.1 T9SS type A sorting domain-containing protein [Bacteroidia bacterium]